MCTCTVYTYVHYREKVHFDPTLEYHVYVYIMSFLGPIIKLLEQLLKNTKNNQINPKLQILIRSGLIKCIHVYKMYIRQGQSRLHDILVAHFYNTRHVHTCTPIHMCACVCTCTTLLERYCTFYTNCIKWKSNWKHVCHTNSTLLCPPSKINAKHFPISSSRSPQDKINGSNPAVYSMYSTCTCTVCMYVHVHVQGQSHNVHVAVVLITGNFNFNHWLFVSYIHLTWYLSHADCYKLFMK